MGAWTLKHGTGKAEAGRSLFRTSQGYIVKPLPQNHKQNWVLGFCLFLLLSVAPSSLPRGTMISTSLQQGSYVCVSRHLHWDQAQYGTQGLSRGSIRHGQDRCLAWGQTWQAGTHTREATASA